MAEPTAYPHWLDVIGACRGCGQIEPPEGSECPYAKQRDKWMEAQP